MENKSDSLQSADNEAYHKAIIRYYVSNQGNDNNTGLSPHEAWRSISKVNNTELIPGTKVFFKRGDEWRETLMVDESGIDGKYIEFAAYGKGPRPIINGADIISGWKKSNMERIWSVHCPEVIDYFGLPFDYNLIIDGKLFTRIDKADELDSDGEFFLEKRSGKNIIYIFSNTDPELKKTEVSARKFGICIVEKKLLIFRDLDLRNCAHSGAYFMAKTVNGQFDGSCILDSCSFHRNRIAGVIFDNGYSSNLVKDCISAFNGNGYYCSSDQDWGSDRNVFSGCYSFSNINHTKGIYSDGHGFGIWNSDDNIVENCESENDKYGIVIDPNGRRNDIIIRYNYIHDTQERSPGINVGGNTPTGTLHQVYYNLIVNTGSGEDGYAIWVYGSSRKGEVHICNNTIYQDGSSFHSAFGILASSGNELKVINNIVFSAGRIPFAVLYLEGSLTGSSISNNVYFTPNNYKEIFYYKGEIRSGISEWQKLIGLEQGSSKLDPLFVKNGTDFSLSKESQCINSGLYLGYKKDKIGNNMVGLPDIGCFERQ